MRMNASNQSREVDTRGLYPEGARDQVTDRGDSRNVERARIGGKSGGVRRHQRIVLPGSRARAIFGDMRRRARFMVARLT
jgi:hypothetical protein